MNPFNLIGVLVAMLIALLVVIFVHPGIVRFAINRRIVDNPDARKLQRNPVPVMGGVAVFVGLVVGLCALELYNALLPRLINIMGCGCSFVPMDVVPLLPVFLGMSIMLVVGVTDDVSGLSPRVRFAIEIAVTLMLMLWTDKLLNDFQGLWGVEVLPTWFAVPLTIVAVVGIINAINLVDGVDGLSSGFCIMASLAFAILFSYSGNVLMLFLCALTVGSLLPFFFHNVFGNNTKMFIGDSGTLVYGTIMSVFVISILEKNPVCIGFMHKGMGLIPFTLAVLSIPVFDTIRVMSTRILHKRSPFSPDKTHLHHMFIDLGFSHTGTTISILTLNSIIIVAWYLSYKLGVSIDVQLYIVLTLSICFTFGLYNFIKRQLAKNGKVLRLLQKISKSINFEKKGVWATIEKCIDKL